MTVRVPIKWREIDGSRLGELLREAADREARLAEDKIGEHDYRAAATQMKDAAALQELGRLCEDANLAQESWEAAIRLADSLETAARDLIPRAFGVAIGWEYLKPPTKEEQAELKRLGLTMAAPRGKK